ncbi:MAG: YbaN family protein [Alphaproteobacteria bacterium]
MPPVNLHNWIAMRWLFAGLGVFFVVLAFVGIFLPALPTTPFLIIAAFLFAKSSPRMHRWLYDHKAFGPLLRDWAAYRVIPAWAKVMAIGCMLASLTYLSLFSTAPVWATGCAGAVMVIGAVYILTKPSTRPPNVPF